MPPNVIVFRSTKTDLTNLSLPNLFYITIYNNKPQSSYNITQSVVLIVAD